MYKFKKINGRLFNYDLLVSCIINATNSSCELCYSYVIYVFTLKIEKNMANHYQNHSILSFVKFIKTKND